MTKFLATCEASDKATIAFILTFPESLVSPDFEFNVDYDVKSESVSIYSEEDRDVQDYDHDEFRKYFMQAFKASYRDDDYTTPDFPQFFFEYDNSEHEGI